MQIIGWDDTNGQQKCHFPSVLMENKTHFHGNQKYKHPSLSTPFPDPHCDPIGHSRFPGLLPTLLPSTAQEISISRFVRYGRSSECRRGNYGHHSEYMISLAVDEEQVPATMTLITDGLFILLVHWASRTKWISALFDNPLLAFRGHTATEPPNEDDLSHFSLQTK